MPETFQIVEDRFTPPAPLPSTTQDTGLQYFPLVEEDFPPPRDEPEEAEEFEEMVTEYDRHGKEVSLPVYDDAGKRLHRPKYDSTGRMTHSERGVMTYDEWLKQKNEGDVDWWEVATGAVKHLAGGFTKIPGKIKEEGVLEASANIPESFLAAMEGVRMIGGGAGRLLAKPFRTEEEENKAEYEAYAEFGDQIFRQLELRKSRMGDVARMFGAKELAEVYDDGIDPEVADSLSLIFDPTYLVGGGLAKVGAAGMRHVPKVTNKYAKQVMAAASKAANTKIGAAGGKALKEVGQRVATPITSFVSGTGKVGEVVGRGMQKGAEIGEKVITKAPTVGVVGGGTLGYFTAPEGRKLEGVLTGAATGGVLGTGIRYGGQLGESLEKTAQRIGGAAEAAKINSVRVSGLGTVAKTRKMSEDVAKQFVKYDNRVANKLLSGAAKIADTVAVGAGLGAGIGSLMPTDPNNPGWAAGLGIGTFAAPAGLASAKALSKLARVEISRGGVPSADLRLRIKETPDHQLASEAVVERFAAGLPEEQRVRFVDPDRGLSVHDMATQAEAVNWAMGAKRYAGKDVDLFVGNAQEVMAETGNRFHETVAGFYWPDTNKIYINTDAEVSTMTLLHEVFHPTETWSSRQKKLDTELDETIDVDPLQDLQTDLVQTIVGTYGPDGSQMKAGLYSADELGKLIDQYNSKLYPDQTSKIIAKKAEIAEEFKKSGGAETPDLALMNRELDELTIKQDDRAKELAAFEMLPESEKRNFIAREILSEQFAMFGESARHGIIRKARNTVLKKDYFRDKFLGMEIDKLKLHTLGRLRKTLEQVGVKFDLAGNPRGDMTATSVIFKDPKTGRQMVVDPGVEHLIAQYIIEKDKLVTRVSETDEVGGSEVTYKAGDAVKKNKDGTPKIPAAIIERWAESGWVKVYKSKKPTDEKPTTKKPTDEKPTDEKPTDEKPTDEKPTDDKLKDGDILNSTGGKWQPGQRPAFTTARERTRMDKNRVAALVSALEPVTKQVGEDEPSVGVVQWRETADGGKNFSGGYFDDAQMAAIMDAPDDVVRPVFKENIRMMNEAVKNREGQPFLADYWKAISGGGYTSKARMKVQLFTPIGMSISSHGNFNATVFNIGYFDNKINRWLGQSGKKKFWKEWADEDGRVDVDAFRNDVLELLGTHLADDPAKRFPEGVKKEKMYSFLGIKPFEPGRKDWNVSAKDRKQIHSLRVDRMQELTPGMGENFPINYGKARARYMPGEATRPPVDDLGFYSRVAEVAAGDKIPTRATGDQMLATIAKQPGVKKEEIAWLGLEDFLRGKKQVTKQELSDFIRENDVRLEETVYSGDRFDPIDPDKKTKPTQYEDYQLPGAEPGSYREMVLRLPTERQKSRVVEGDDGLFYIEHSDGSRSSHGIDSRQAAERELTAYVERESTGEYHRKDPSNYQSSHWDEPNVLAHVRFNDRTGPNGEKILFVEEVQSDWHREGRKSGYAGEAGKPKAAILKSNSGESYALYSPDKERIGWFSTREEAAEKATSLGFEPVNEVPPTRLEKVPDAPFKTSWHELVMKRMLRHAAENGYEKLAWISGDETAKRYDLSKQVNEIAVPSVESNVRSVRIDPIRGTSFKLMVDNGGKVDGVLSAKQFTGKQLDEVIGKEMAEKVMAFESPGKLTGVDLKVGGEWASNLYDRMIPQFMKKYGKKFGAKVEDFSVAIPDEPFQPRGSSFKAIDITPAMRGDEAGSVVGGQVKFMPGVSNANAFGSAKKNHGLTRNIEEAGYILPDGKLLDFSGRHWTDEYFLKDGYWELKPKYGKDHMTGQRQVDHREVEYDGVPADEQWSGMVDFMKRGAVRVDAKSGMISVHGRTPLTKQQEIRVKEISDLKDGEIYLDAEDDAGKRLSLEYDVSNSKRIIGDLRRWARGDEPESGKRFMPATPGIRTPTQITPTSQPVKLVMDKIYRLPEREKEERKDRAMEILQKFIEQ